MESHREPDLREVDPEIAALIEGEDRRQRESLRLIASENYASKAVLEASASTLTNKYAEGYPGRRYYEGMDFVDPIERLAIDRAKRLFGAEHANVQPYSGSPANLAVLLGLCAPGDTIMGLSLPAGGHLTHGWKVSATGIYYHSVQYGVRREDHRIDMDQVRDLAREQRPKLIWCGHSAYPRLLDFEAFAAIAQEVGAYLVADIAHIAGLIAGGVHPSPIPHADAVTTTTHKTLRGPRGGLILCKAEHAAKIDKAVFPGLQGGPHNHTTAAKAVAFHEALQPAFKVYQQQVAANAVVMAETLAERGLRIVSGRTESHVMLVDLRPKGLTGKEAEAVLGQAHMTCNKNGIPNDPQKPMVTSGIRLGTPAITTRGFGEAETRRTANLIADVLDRPHDEANLAAVREQVAALTREFPVYR
ncbi:MAG: serine hydroxymethyltransferase [Rhodoferax sp.]|nr:serine hydroxymethyltransferase [Rhodoferax sp.]